MTAPAVKTLKATSGIISFLRASSQVQRLSLKSLINFTLLHKNCNSQIIYASCLQYVGIRNSTNTNCFVKLYSTKTSPHEPNERDISRCQNHCTQETENKTNCGKDEKSDEYNERGKPGGYMKKASKATEKMKTMADTMKDVKENILTIPNLLSTTRLVLAPVLGYLVLQESYTIGVCLFAVAGVTDLLDGFIARNFRNQQSVLGSIIDPLADKCLVAVLALSLTVSGLIPVPLTILMVSRDVGLVSSALYLRYQSLPPPRTITRFFNITHATVQLKPTAVSKLNTAVQLGLVGFTLAAPVFHYVDHPLLHALWYATAATTVLSGLSYVFSKDAFKFLRK